jgi:succinyl-CoA synthetase alpha subunit
MKISDKVKRASSGILEASVIMATPTNKGILIRLGFQASDVIKANESDVIIAVRARDQDSLNIALKEANELLESPDKLSSGQKDAKITDLDSALRTMSDANLVLLSVPGDHVKDISLKLIDLRIHQQIFSDHVPIEDELAIKKQAIKNGVLILGPGAGTSVINGRGIGFSNAVKEGPVGVVAAAGTGLQEVITLLDHCDIGVKHGLGVGGNDPKEKIGGIMMLECIKILEQDPQIEIIGIVSKPPSPSVQENIFSYISTHGKKKYVVAFIGGTQAQGDRRDGRIIQVSSLASAALAFAKHLGKQQLNRATTETFLSQGDMLSALKEEWTRLRKDQRYIRALYTGGTFTYEAQVILSTMLHDAIYSNAPILNIKQMPDSFTSIENSIVDLGEEEFTEGRPHPMIDPTLRKLRLLQEARDPDVAVLLMDFVLGYASHHDPVGAVLNEITEAKAIAAKDGRHLSVVSHVCGTRGDQQGYQSSISRLRSVGSVVLPTNAAAAVAAATVALRGKVDLDKTYSQYLMLGGGLQDG